MTTISFTLARRPFELSDDESGLASRTIGPTRSTSTGSRSMASAGRSSRSWLSPRGLSNSEFQSQNGRRLLAKLGFTIGKGNAALPPPARAVKGSAPENVQAHPPADVVLVGCVKSKRPHGAAAKDLYTSDYFSKMRAYAESRGRPWFVLSAEHGLVGPDEWLEPYDCYLPDMSRAYGRDWGLRVAAQLEESVGPLEGVVFDIHAGAAYVEAVVAALGPLGAVVTDQLQGLSFGRRLSWYVRQGCESAVSARTVAEDLRDEARVVTLADLVASNGEGLRTPGMYSWWVDSRGAEDLSRGLGHEIAAGLIYAGLAGATRSGGSTSSNTLWGRIAMHLGKRHDLSTLRRSLGSVLASASGWPAIDEVELTRWMHAHLSVVAVPVADADTLDALESEILTELDPPLNLAKVSKTPLRTQLSALRKRYADEESGMHVGGTGSENGRGSWSAEVRRCVVRPA